MASGVKITKNNVSAVKAAFKGAKTRALTAAGIEAQGGIVKVTPVDTGNLRNSIGYRVDGDTAVHVGTDVNYGVYVELGTRKMSAQPYIKPGVMENTGAIGSAIAKELSSIG